jgi:hypothetical protein
LTMARTVWSRVYVDFLMPSRLPAYRSMLEAALTAGYAIESIEQFWGRIVGGTLDPDSRYLILRHDVDTDPGTAAEMWRIERSLGVRGSFYFRLSTIDLRLIEAISADGGEVGYHYEELATIAKRRRLRSRDEVVDHVPEAQELFARHLTRLRDITGLPMRIVASHGDFINRRLHVDNLEILADAAFRRKVGVDLETYDDAFMKHVTARHADAFHPVYWKPGDPLVAIDRREPVIYVLVHPREWRTAWRVNARDDLRRVAEGARYAVPSRRRRRTGGA